jgi:hypothetical protein
MEKHIITTDRVRRVPRQFSWVDHRLVRGNYLMTASAPAWALYLVLVTVGDEHGLSYYADRTLARPVEEQPGVVPADLGGPFGQPLVQGEGRHLMIGGEGRRADEGEQEGKCRASAGCNHGAMKVDLLSVH